MRRAPTANEIRSRTAMGNRALGSHGRTAPTARQQWAQLAARQRAYRRYASYYDAVFGPVLEAGRKRAVQTLNQVAGQRILEVGIGTGLSLPYYRDSPAAWASSSPAACKCQGARSRNVAT